MMFFINMIIIPIAAGYSIFIGTVILVGSLLPFLVDGLPPNNVFMLGILIVLFGVFFNGKARSIKASRK